MSITRINSRLPTLALGILLWSAETGAPRAWAEPIHVVLANGSVIRGELSRDGKGYVVREGGATLHLRENEVACVCRDLAAAYLHFLTSLDDGDWDGRLRLVGWCISHGLFDQAEWDLDRLEREDSRDARIAPLRRRLELVRARHQGSFVDTSVAGAAGSAQPRSTTFSAPSSRSHSPFARDVRHVPDLSREAMEQFTRRIQPLLLNACGAAGCHGSAKASFAIRSPKRAGAPGHVTAANLREVLSRVSPDGENCALFRAHASELGGSRVGMLTASQQAELLQWIDLVHSPTEEEGAAAPGCPPGSEPRGTAHGLPDAMRPSQPVATRWASPTPPPNNEPWDASAVARVEERPAFTPRDPFDPEIFNRRYFPERYP